jgi:hypothetical protein
VHCSNERRDLLRHLAEEALVSIVAAGDERRRSIVEVSRAPNLGPDRTGCGRRITGIRLPNGSAAGVALTRKQLSAGSILVLVGLGFNIVSQELI